jgi:hypothetical protein
MHVSQPETLRPLPELMRAQRRTVRMAVREARLRPEWAHLYPGLASEVWMVAAQLVPLVLRHRLQDQATWEFTQRILVDEHFEFRGGHDRDESWSGLLTRVEDA